MNGLWRKGLAGMILAVGLGSASLLMSKGLQADPSGPLTPVSPAGGARVRAAPALRDRPTAAPSSPLAIASETPELTDWVQRWTAAQLEGKSATEQDLAQLREIIEGKAVSLPQAIDTVCLIASMDGGAKLEPICAPIVDRAAADLAAFTPPDPAAKTIVDGLLRIHNVLWQAGHYKLDQRVIELTRPWEVRGSGHSQMMSYVYAECLQYQGLPGLAYEAYVDAAAERRDAFEPSLGTNGSLNMELGKMLFLMSRYAEAEKHLKLCASERRGGDMGDVLTVLALSLVRQNKLDDARTYITRFYDQKCSSVLEMQMLAEFGARTEKLASARSREARN